MAPGGREFRLMPESHFFRTNSGHLHLISGIGRVSLADAILIEDPSENDDDLGKVTVPTPVSHTATHQYLSPQSLYRPVDRDIVRGRCVVLNRLDRSFTGFHGNI